MADNFNTIAGWALASLIVGWGVSSVSAHYFDANKPDRPEQMGYKIAGVVEDGGEGAKEEPIEVRLASADPAKGENTFKKCMSCHTINQGGANGIGPNLYGIVGAGIGKHAAGFAYSSDLVAHGGNWDFANLDKWLANPKGMVAATKMTFAGLDDPAERANLIAYMNAQGSNVPVPAAPAAAPAEGVAAAGAAPAEGAASAPAEAPKH
ncbi:MAG: cytochrome c family protein [Novosphingobium sp.]